MFLGFLPSSIKIHAKRKMTMILQLLFFLGALHSTCGQSSNPQNLETFYPSPSSLQPFPTPPNDSFFVTPPPPPPSSSNNDVAKAVAITAAGTFVFASLLFFLIQRCIVAPRRRKRQVVAYDHKSAPAGGGGAGMADHNARFSQVGSKVKGMIVDENGLDVIYWRKLEEGSNGGRRANGDDIPKEEGNGDDIPKEEGNGDIPKEEGEVFTSSKRKKKVEPIQEVPLLRGKSSGSHLNGGQENQEPTNNFNGELSSGGWGSSFQAQRSNLSLPPPPGKQTPTPRPVPPPPPAPAPALAVERNYSGSGRPPPPPPIPLKMGGAGPPPPPPPKYVAKAASDYKGKKLVSSEEAGERERGSNGQVKLKPLHWDKVNKNTDHSMVWDKLGTGSFRFDDNLMEALFGYVATNRKSPKSYGSSTPKTNSPPAQVVILEPRKSQNTAIVIKSLSISRREILDALTDGYGLDVDILEKLVRIAPSKEEELQILEFQGDANRLADAESFLYSLLKAVPSAFSRFNAMYFRSSYDTDVRQFKEHLETLELGSKELRDRGLFMKLLEAILKAGNRMNAGTARGNAQAFKLSSLRKLSDVKSTDGKTTLLHFVVEEVVRSEGKKLVLNKSSSRNSTSSLNSESSVPKEDRDREYKMLGLPVVGGLSSEFSNVKKAAQIDYETFAGTLSALSTRVRDIKLIVARSAAAGEPGGGFVKEMKAFYETAEGELNGWKRDEKRVMELVKSTTEYYQAGAENDSAAHQLQLFVIIKDFLGMVDRVCIEVARSLQRKKARQSGSESGSPGPTAPKARVRFPNLPAHFLGERSKSSSSASDSES